MKKNPNTGQEPRRALELRRDILRELSRDDMRLVAGGTGTSGKPSAPHPG